jgi:hypothetical protein
MSLRFKTNLLEHLKAVGAWARLHDVDAQVRATDTALVLRHRGQALLLLPQFVGKRVLAGAGGGAGEPAVERLSYFATPDDHARGFVGWLPYAPLAWDISVSKLAFKTVAVEAGLRVPAWWTNAADADSAYLVKRVRGAFGDGMRGPFSPHAPQAPQAGPLSQPPHPPQPPHPADGEFCEAFVEGRIARAWYWSGRLAVLEVLPMPQVLGDGRTPLFAALAALQGLSAASVPAAGQAVTADYRYVSPLNPTLYANHNGLRTAQFDSPLVQAFEDAGTQLWPRIPGALGPAGKQAGFVLDAIVGADGLPWFLEINSNAQGHPDWYAPMLDAICAPWFAAAGTPTGPERTAPDTQAPRKAA